MFLKLFNTKNINIIMDNYKIYLNLTLKTGVTIQLLLDKITLSNP